MTLAPLGIEYEAQLTVMTHTPYKTHYSCVRKSCMAH
jgi:hypothetical protein